MGVRWSELNAHKTRRTWWLSKPSPRAQLQTARRERFETGRAQAEKRELRQSLEPTLWLARSSSPPTRTSSSPPPPAFSFPFFFSRYRCQSHPDPLLVTPWPRTPTIRYARARGGGRRGGWKLMRRTQRRDLSEASGRAPVLCFLLRAKTFFFDLVREREREWTKGSLASKPLTFIDL